MKHRIRTIPPQGWRTERLKDISRINTRTLPSTTIPDFQFAYLEISNVDDRGVIDETAIENMRFEDAPSRARRIVNDGNILISSVRPNLQAIAHITSSKGLICSTGFNVIDVDSSSINPRFCYYSVLSNNAREYFEANATGVGYPAIGDKYFGSLELNLPPLNEQRRIAAFLDASCAAIDEAIEKKRRQREVLENAKKKTIAHTFLSGLDLNIKTREVDKDWIRSIPAHWQIVQVKRVLARMDYGISESTEPDGKYAVLKMGHIQDGELIVKEIDYVDEVETDLLLEKDDILYNRTNSPDQVAKSAIFRGQKSEGITFASYLVRLRMNHKIRPEYFNFLANSEGFLGFARKMAIPSVQQSNLNSTRYGKMLIPLPPLTEQDSIIEYLQQISADYSSMNNKLSQQIATLTAYRASLIHECVTGQRRVTETDLERVSAALR